MNDSKAASFTESQLRHPLERPYFLASVVLSLIVVAAGIIIILFAPDWLESHALLSKEATAVRAALIAALAGLPLLALLRNRRDVYIHEQSIRLSRNQFAPIYGILEKQCQRLGMTDVQVSASQTKLFRRTPRPFLLGTTIPSCSTRIYLKWISTKRSMSPPLPSVANLAECGSGVPFFANPLRQLRTFSRDRYGAYLAPAGFRGLLFVASARRLLNDVNVDDYLKKEKNL
jgi:hypothetical protein